MSDVRGVTFQIFLIVVGWFFVLFFSTVASVWLIQPLWMIRVVWISGWI